MKKVLSILLLIGFTLGANAQDYTSIVKQMNFVEYQADYTSAIRLKKLLDAIINVPDSVLQAHLDTAGASDLTAVLEAGSIYEGSQRMKFKTNNNDYIDIYNTGTGSTIEGRKFGALNFQIPSSGEAEFAAVETPFLGIRNAFGSFVFEGLNFTLEDQNGSKGIEGQVLTKGDGPGKVSWQDVGGNQTLQELIEFSNVAGLAEYAGDEQYSYYFNNGTYEGILGIYENLNEFSVYGPAYSSYLWVVDDYVEIVSDGPGGRRATVWGEDGIWFQGPLDFSSYPDSTFLLQTNAGGAIGVPWDSIMGSGGGGSSGSAAVSLSVQGMLLDDSTTVSQTVSEDGTFDFIIKIDVDAPDDSAVSKIREHHYYYFEGTKTAGSFTINTATDVSYVDNPIIGAGQLVDVTFNETSTGFDIKYKMLYSEGGSVVTEVSRN